MKFIEFRSHNVPVITKGKVVHAPLASSACLERFEHNIHNTLARKYIPADNTNIF
jgi:hypothetical protein